MDFSRVLSVYEGRDGRCCCGCSGAHVYRSDPGMRALAGSSRGYVVTDDEVDDAEFGRIVAEIVEDVECGFLDAWSEDHVATVVGGTVRIAYLAPEVPSVAA